MGIDIIFVVFLWLILHRTLYAVYNKISVNLLPYVFRHIGHSERDVTTCIPPRLCPTGVGDAKRLKRLKEANDRSVGSVVATYPNGRQANLKSKYMKLYNVDVGTELLSELMGHGARHIRSACIAQTTVHTLIL